MTIEGSAYEIASIYAPENVKTINDLIETGIKSGEKTGAWDAVLQAMRENSMAWEEACPPDQTGVHPGNRSSFGVGGADSQHLGFGILQVGWSWSKAKDATAIQSPPGSLTTEAAEYNKMLVDASDGLIPPLTLMRCLTIGGGHTNVFLRQCCGNVPNIMGKESP